MGTCYAYSWGGGGGGGTFVAKKVDSSNYSFSKDNSYVIPLIIAAGGGGSGDGDHSGNKERDDGHCESVEEGGGATGETHSSGGAGFASDAKSGEAKSFLNGGVGSTSPQSEGYSYGGFGGGGHPWNGGGGGGGYRGGDSGPCGARGMGGYSYSLNKNISCIPGANAGQGSVLIIPVNNLNIFITNCRQTRMDYSLIFMLILFSK